MNAALDFNLGKAVGDFDIRNDTFVLSHKIVILYYSSIVN